MQQVLFKLHYKSMKSDVYFQKVAYVQYLAEVDIFHTQVKKFFLFTTVQKL